MKKTKSGGICKGGTMNKELAKTYNPKEIEEKLYEKWCENKYFHAEVDRSKKPFRIVYAASEYYS